FVCRSSRIREPAGRHGSRRSTTRRPVERDCPRRGAAVASSPCSLPTRRRAAPDALGAPWLAALPALEQVRNGLADQLAEAGPLVERELAQAMMRLRIEGNGRGLHGLLRGLGA